MERIALSGKLAIQGYRRIISLPAHHFNHCNHRLGTRLASGNYRWIRPDRLV